MGMNHVSHKELKCKVDEYAFMLTDLNLYLNTHPHDEVAMEKFRHYQHLYRHALQEYEQHFGPMIANHANAETEWIWATTPWPWQKGCE